jgi:DNA-binding MarR family transcriptional regulator
MGRKLYEVINKRMFIYSSWVLSEDKSRVNKFATELAKKIGIDRSTVLYHLKYVNEVINGERKDKELKELLIGKNYCLINGEIFECLKSVTIDNETFVLYLDNGIEKRAQVDEHMVGSIEEIKDKYISWISKLFYKFRGKKAKEQFNKLNNETF